MSHIGNHNHNPTTSVFNKPVKNETLTKVDKSPVTVADYSTQAVVNMILRHAFPADPIVGKEDAGELCQASGEALRDLELANDELTAELRIGEERTPAELMICWMDGVSAVMISLTSVFLGRWTLDPIDGTMGLLRGGQYAVCLALMDDEEVVLGIVGRPNLPVNNAEPHGPKGCIFIAVVAQGAEQTILSGTNPTPLTIPPVAPRTLNLLASVEAAYSDLAGDGGVYPRMLTRARYKEIIWVKRAGVVTDSRGQALDFGLGRDLGENHGVLAAVQKAQAEEKERAEA
ncbi:hypothetical protein BU15DRAFT_90974 [Melanogaster broomeanus]|nr:hypothetical protein BU15DRAFT_90974 [Melanogaster broomeanus]